MNTEERDAAYWKRRYDAKCEEVAKLRKALAKLRKALDKIYTKTDQLTVYTIVEEALK